MKSRKYINIFPISVFLIFLFIFPCLSHAATEHTDIIKQDCTGIENCFTSLEQWQESKGGVDFVECDSGDLVCAD